MEIELFYAMSEKMKIRIVGEKSAQKSGIEKLIGDEYFKMTHI